MLAFFRIFAARQSRLKFHLVLMAGGAILPIILAAGFHISRAAQQDYDSAQERLVEIVRGRARETELLLDTYRKLMMRLADRPLIKALDKTACDPVMTESGQFFSITATVEIGVFNTKAERICGYRGDLPPNQRAVRENRNISEIIAEEAWFRDGLALATFNASDSFLDNRGRWVTILTYPILGGSGQVEGLLAFSLELAALQKMALMRIPTGLTVAVLDGSNRFLMRSLEPERWRGKEAPGLLNAEQANQAERPIAIRGFAGGDERLLVSSPVLGTKWIAYGSQKTSDITAPERSLIISGTVGLLLSFGLSVLLASKLAGRITEDFAVQESKIRASEERYRSILNFSPVPMAVNNRDGQITFLNRAFTQALGYDLGDIPTLEAWWPRAYPDQAYRQFVAQEWSRRLKAYFESSKNFESMELNIRTKDGRTLVMIVSAGALGTNIDAEHVVTLQDVTEQRQAEEQRLTLANEYAELIRTARDPILTVNSKGIITQANPAAEILFGYSDGLVRVPLSALLERRLHDKHETWVQRFFRSGEKSIAMAQLRTIEGRHKDGSPLRLQITISQSLGSGGAQATAFIRDVTTVEGLQERVHQADRLAALGQLTGGIAHDVNNVLAIVLGSAEMIQEGSNPGSRINVLAERVAKSASRAADLMKHLLAFSRKSSIEPMTLDLGRTVADTTSALRQTLGVRVSIRIIQPPEPAWVFVDRAMLESCLINLCVNARDAMPSGGLLTLDLSVDQDANKAEAKRWATLRVTDTGIGMSEEVRKRVFDPFFTTKKVGSGTGLGLSMVYGFVQQSGGSIEVASVPNQGSTFTVRFPLVSAPIALDQLGEDAINAGDGRMVLVVEDNEAVAMTLKEQLEFIGCRVFTAASFEEAATSIREKPGLNLVLSDLDLGGGPSGVDLAEWMKDQGYAIRGAILSGYLNLPLERINAAGWRHIQKPAEMRELVRLLRDDVGKSSTVSL